MVAKEAAFFLLIILSPLALGSKTPVRPKGKMKRSLSNILCLFLVFNKTKQLIETFLKMHESWNIYFMILFLGHLVDYPIHMANATSVSLYNWSPSVVLRLEGL